MEKISGKNTSKTLFSAHRVRREELQCIWKPKTSLLSESKPKRESHIISDCGIRHYVSIRMDQSILKIDITKNYFDAGEMGLFSNGNIDCANGPCEVFQLKW